MARKVYATVTIEVVVTLDDEADLWQKMQSLDPAFTIKDGEVEVLEWEWEDH